MRAKSCVADVLLSEELRSSTSFAVAVAAKILEKPL
jgi:hypothetical protein